jgi:hypothetical protein
MTKKKSVASSSRRAPGWDLVVRLANGSRAYYFLDGTSRDFRGAPLESWGRESQAMRFPSEEAAGLVAAGMQTNGTAKEYTVVRLPWKADSQA